MATNGTTKLFGLLFIPTQSLSNWAHTVSDFGQILPLLLLTAPFFMMVQTFSNETHAFDTITMPTGNQLFPEPVGEHLEVDIATRGHDANVAVDPANGSQEDLFSFQRYSEAYWLNHMVLLAAVGAILVSWATVLSFTVSAAFPHILVLGDRRGSDYITRTVINFFGCDLMILGHVVIVANYTAISKYSKVLIWALVWSFVAYMSWLCRGTPISLALWAQDLSSIPLWSLPVLHATICIGLIFQKLAPRPRWVRPGGESLESNTDNSPNSAA